MQMVMRLLKSNANSSVKILRVLQPNVVHKRCVKNLILTSLQTCQPVWTHAYYRVRSSTNNAYNGTEYKAVSYTHLDVYKRQELKTKVVAFIGNEPVRTKICMLQHTHRTSKTFQLSWT